MDFTALCGASGDRTLDKLRASGVPAPGRRLRLCALDGVPLARAPVDVLLAGDAAPTGRCRWWDESVGARPSTEPTLALPGAFRLLLDWPAGDVHSMQQWRVSNRLVANTRPGQDTHHCCPRCPRKTHRLWEQARARALSFHARDWRRWKRVSSRLRGKARLQKPWAMDKSQRAKVACQLRHGCVLSSLHSQLHPSRAPRNAHHRGTPPRVCDRVHEF